MIDQYAVFGFPIGHSKSPLIHAQFAEQTEQLLNYQAIEVPPEAFDQAITEFFKTNGKGLNCTVPLKELAFEKVDKLTERAQFSGAVNTIKLMEDGFLLGDNTDGVGLLSDLCENLGLTLKGKHLLVLGAGGASRGILGPLLESKPSVLQLANRTVSKAQAMVELFKDIGCIEASSYDGLEGLQFDVIINATSASLTGELPPLAEGLLATGGVCYDLTYSNEPTAFVLWGREQGATLSIDGLGMLAEQAAHAFKLWRGVMPKTQRVRALLRT